MSNSNSPPMSDPAPDFAASQTTSASQAESVFQWLFGTVWRDGLLDGAITFWKSLKEGHPLAVAVAGTTVFAAVVTGLCLSRLQCCQQKQRKSPVSKKKAKSQTTSRRGSTSSAPSVESEEDTKAKGGRKAGGKACASASRGDIAEGGKGGDDIKTGGGGGRSKGKKKVEGEAGGKQMEASPEARGGADEGQAGMVGEWQVVQGKRRKAKPTKTT
eukprot:GHVQ01029629.1.p1 GENE.GHVQ01029629.1~~GHVQ01029629.1.p1  ORF type:complete len:215 (-),score=56.60 GHVQ01029629.1:636-1280(-)